MPTCPHCHAYVEDGYATCGSCGRLLREGTTTTSPRTSGEWTDLATDAGNVGTVLSFVAWTSLVLGVLAAFFLAVGDHLLAGAATVVSAIGTWSMTLLGSVVARYVSLLARERRA
ncbi:MAG: hypothetical protein ACTHOD_08165 [Motilibacteraceae bacterium]